MNDQIRKFSIVFVIGLLIAAPASAESTVAQNGIVFVGSSIFRYWTHLTEQMAPLPVVNRAIAGTTTQDMLNRLDQLVLAHHPRIVVFYCGSNDVSSGDSAEAIVRRTKKFVQILHEKLPGTYFYYTAIQKAPEKRERWDVVDSVNREMERYAHSDPEAGYIDLNPVLFDGRGNIREDLFLPDGLHFRNGSSAYPEFARIVKPILSMAWERVTSSERK